MSITARKHWMSLAPCSSSVFPRQHGLPPWSESSERICPLEILKSKEQGGTATSLGICISKKVEVYQEQLLFLRKCTPDRKIPVFIHGSILLPGNMFKCSKKQLWWSPNKPQPSTAGWEFPHTSCTGWSSPSKWEQRKLSCPICPLWLSSKDIPAVLVLHKQCHMQMHHSISATRFKHFLIHTLQTQKTLCSLWLLCSVFLLAWRTTHWLLLLRERDSFRVLSAVI